MRGERGLRVKMFMLDKRYLGVFGRVFVCGSYRIPSNDQGPLVFTDSFHGTIFAIHFERRFYTLETFWEQAENNQNSRIENLFSKIGFTGLFLG